MQAITSVLGLVSTGQIALTSLPIQLQTLVAQYPGGVSSLLSLATSLSSVNSFLSLNVGSTINQAISTVSSFGSAFTSSINQVASVLVSVNKSREFAIEAADPDPPLQADPPATTSSKASTKPSSNTTIASSNPYLISEQQQAEFNEVNASPTDPLASEVNSTQTDTAVDNTNLANQIDASIVSSAQIDSAAIDNENIMKQIGAQQETQQAAAAESRNVIAEAVAARAARRR
jgi:hypothetical protein